MFMNPGGSLAVWSVEFALAYLMLGIGFWIGRWSLRNQKSSGEEKERAVQAAARIQALADRVAQDVGEHSSRVREISTDLSASGRDNGAPLDEVVLKSIDDIVKANERLQEQLATAEVRLQRQAAELETQTTVARTDPLTLLSNRRALDDEMNRRFAEWQRRKTTFSLAMIDVDHFKKLNDKHGHQAGDQVLRDVAATLGTTVREMDLAARYGGEEFAVILPSTPLIDAVSAGERIRAAIAGGISRFGGTEMQVTVSIGVAQIGGGDTSATLITRADAALYAAKEAGRNRVWLHDGENTSPAVAAKPQTVPSAPVEPARAAEIVQPQEPLTCQSVVKSMDSRSPTAFCTDLKRRLLECQKFGVPLTLVLLDIDDFKPLVDNLGTSARELVVNTLSEFLTMSLHDIDVVSHYGDGHFAIMMPGTELGGAIKMAERLRSVISSCALPVRGEELRFTISLGLAQAQSSDDPRSLVKRADAALLASKEAGGNRVHQHTGERCESTAALAAAC
ncbi:MAG TPA: GGDEF domain-containing protein [Pirellulales bacterium]|jgi:diguanylate cyclase|nr:GGDEF domain-containing protein [Pirellulales bacterium]